jgi:hypothetical protein
MSIENLKTFGMFTLIPARDFALRELSLCKVVPAPHRQIFENAANSNRQILLASGSYSH